MQPTQNQENHGETPGLVPKESFCPWVSRLQRGQCRAVCVASNGQLRHRESELVSGKFSLKFSSVSLATLLDKGLLVNTQQKTLLSYLLIKAVWEFYYSDWMMKEWSKHSIHFMYRADGFFPSQEAQEAQPYAIYISEPFIDADFQSPLSMEPKESNFPTGSHPYPKILALGIMLLEIELGKHILNQNGRETESVPNAKHMAATKILFTEEWRNKEHGGLQYIRDIIEICVTPDKTKLGTDPDSLRNVLYQEFVQPCHKGFSESWREDPDTFDVRLKLPGDMNSKSRTRNQTPPQQPSASPVQNTANDQGQCDLTVQTSRSAPQA